MKAKESTAIFPESAKNEQFFKQHVGIGTTFDVGLRTFTIYRKTIQLYYVNGLSESLFIMNLIKEVVNLNENHPKITDVKSLIQNRLIHQQVSSIHSLDEATDKLLSGLIIILVEGETEGFAIDVRQYPGRSPEEPDTEKVVRGARDGYTENIIVNTALTRRRIRDERLRNEMVQVGERSKTDICISYLQDVADPGLVKTIKTEIENMSIDGLPMGDKTLEEFLVKQGLFPFPLVRYTERPDVAVSHLLEGHVLIFVDTSPSIMITPTTFFHHVQHAEEFRQNRAIGIYLRWIRFIGIFASLFLLPLWYLYVLEPDLLPKTLDFIGPDKKSDIPVFVQLIVAELGIDLLRMAAIHTPTPLSTAMGLVAAVLIGQIAVDVGLFIREVILYIAIATMGTFATPSYELSIANKIARLVLLTLVGLFHVPGFMIGVTLLVLLLVSKKSFHAPYFWPLIPFEGRALFNIFIRQPLSKEKERPSIVHPQNKLREPK